jgi:hypothetical protein
MDHRVDHAQDETETQEQRYLRVPATDAFTVIHTAATTTTARATASPSLLSFPAEASERSLWITG